MTKRTAQSLSRAAQRAGDLIPATDTFVVITACLDYLRVREEEATKRAHIAAQRDALIEAITAERTFLDEYMTRRFAERKVVLDQFFATLDAGLQGHDHHVVDAALGGILGVLQDNPLKDLETFRTLWKDRSVIIDL